MHFYQLKYIEDRTKKSPSIKGFREGYDIYAKNSASEISRYNEITFTPDLDFDLVGNGEPTDLLETYTVSSHCLYVSSRLYGLLKEYKLLRHQRFDAVLRHGNNKYIYSFLHFFEKFASDETNLVDFQQTRFYAQMAPYPISIMALPTDNEGILGEFQVNSWIEYLDLRAKMENDSTHKLILPRDVLYIKNKEFLDLDLFYVDFKNFSPQTFVVSEKLAKEIASNNITGAKIEPLSYEIRLST